MLPIHNVTFLLTTTIKLVVFILTVKIALFKHENVFLLHVCHWNDWKHCYLKLEKSIHFILLSITAILVVNHKKKIYNFSCWVYGSVLQLMLLLPIWGVPGSTDDSTSSGNTPPPPLQCEVDQSVFDPPADYTMLGPSRSEPMRDEDDNLLQFAIQQSLLDAGTESDQVSCLMMTLNKHHAKPTCDKEIWLCV